MNRQSVAAAITIVIIVQVLGGCALEAKEVISTKNLSKTEAEPVTLTTVSMFGGIDPNAKVYNELKEEFQMEYDYITILDNSQTADEEWKQSVTASFTIGSEPDVLQFFADATANSIVTTNKLVSIEEIRKEYPEYAADTTESALKATTNTDGVSRAVPTIGYWEGMFCNKDLFDRYGVELPTDWESLTKAITVFRENDVIPIACSLDNVPQYWIEYLLLYASGVEAYTQVPETAPPDWVRGLETFKTLRDMGAFPNNTDTIDNAYADQLFRSKKAAMFLNGSWYISNLENQSNMQDTVIIAFPGIEGQKVEKGTIIQGMSSGFYITQKAWDNPLKRDAAVKWVMYNTNKEAVQRYWNGNGAVATEINKDGISPLAKKGIAYAAAAPESVAPTDARLDPEAYSILVAGIVRVSTGELRAEDLLNRVLEINAEKSASNE